MRFRSFALICAVLSAVGLGEEVRVPVHVSREGFRVRGEVRFGEVGRPVVIEVGALGRMVLEPDAGDSAVAIKVYEGEQEVAAETLRLKPLVRKGWGAGVEEELARTAAGMAGWRGRSFTVLVEGERGSVWFWFDGRAIAPVAWRAPIAEVVFRVAEGASVRQPAISALKGERGAFQPLELEGYANVDAKVTVPGGMVSVDGVPFLFSWRAIDVSQAGLRLRKKPSGPGSLYQNPFNFISAMDGDPLTLLLRVPKRYYRRAWLLCGAANDPALSPQVTVRLARYRGEGGAFFSDATVRVPRLADGASDLSRPSVPFGKGRLWVVEVPVDSGAMQDILAADVLERQGNRSAVLKLDSGVPWMEIELTRELRADLNAMLPLGPQSGVQVYGVTLEESPVRMVASSDVNGHLFDAGQAARFNVWLENVTGQAKQVSLVVDGRTRAITLAGGESRTEIVELTARKPGKYDLTFELKGATGGTLVKRQTTYGVLPPDTRKAERDSPFGLWAWGGGHLTIPNEQEAELMRKAGARFTLGVNYPSKEKFGIGTGTDSVIGVFYSSGKVPAGNAEEAAREMVETMKTRGSNPMYWQIYWEDAISNRHHNRYPPSLIGRPPLELDAAEKDRLEAYWVRAEAYAKLSKQQLPQEKLALGAFANFTEEFLRRGFPKQYLDALSLEATAFRNQPERPPTTDNVHGLYFIEEWKKKYGYERLDSIMVESLFHGTAPGYLSERDQANYYVRDFLLGLAYGVKLFAMSAMVTDVSNDYYRSNWGNVGLCHRAPEPSPKESFIAYATMTRVLDQARYEGYIETGTPSVYALHFRSREGAHIYPMWTTRGRRAVMVELGAAKAEIVDGSGTGQALATGRVVLSESPVYVISANEVRLGRMGSPEHTEAPPRDSLAIDALRSLGGWEQRTGRDMVLEDGNPRYPRRAGEFRFSVAKDETAIEVEARPTGGSPLLPMYGVLERRRPIPIAGEPRRIGVWVRGNSGWGRVTYELVDAKGERWMGVGGSEDSYGYGFINFDGWRWVEVDLPGHFRRDYPWPSYGNWTASGGDGIVDYPLSLKSIVVEQRDQVVYVNKLVPVPLKTVRLRGLRAVY